jgi:hypothetical protein
MHTIVYDIIKITQIRDCLKESQREAKPLLPKIFPLSLEGEGDNGGEGVSDGAEKPKTEAKIEAF